MQLQNHSIVFIHKNISLVSASSILSCSLRAYNTTASLDKLTCTDYVEYGKFQDKFEHFSLSKNDSNYLDVKLKIFNKHNNRDFRMVQNLNTREADFNQFMRLRNQPVIAAEKLCYRGKLFNSAVTNAVQSHGRTNQSVSQCG